MSETAQMHESFRIEGPFAIELDDESWTRQLDRAHTWLGNVMTAQIAFRELLESTVPKIEEPNIRLYLSEMLKTARRHEEQAIGLFRAIGREPQSGRGVAGTIVSTARKVLGTIEGVAGGAAGNWRDVRELLIANLDAMGAFAVAEQLGLALAIHELRDLAFQIEAEKSTTSWSCRS